VSLGIRVKLFGGFGVVLALVVAIGFIGLKNTTEFAAQSRSLYEDRLMSVVQLNAVDQALYELRLGAAGETYAGSTPEKRAAIKAQDGTWLKQVDDNMRDYQSSLLVADEQLGLQDWDTVYPAFLKARQQVVDMVDQGNLADAANLRSGDFSSLTQKSTATADRLLLIQQRVGGQMYQDTALMADLSVRVLVFAIVTALVFGIGVAFFVSRGVARGVKAVQQVLTSIAENCASFLEDGLAAMSNSDLSVEVRSTTQPIARFGKDEIGQTAQVTNLLLEKLQSTIASYERARTGLGALVGQVRSTADGVAQSSAHLGTSSNQTGAAVQQVTMAIQNVAAGAQDTSRGAQETNSAVSQLAQAIDGIARGASEQARQVQSASDTATQMAAGVDQVAATAEEVASASHETRKAAEHGGLAVRETTAAMAEIQRVVGQAAGTVEELGKLGDRIGAVVETIDDIAEQTNLLALNAAIEAARAGEHGKGFAVVADEVRKLAERSSRETKQIAELIQQVQAGTKHAVKAMQAGAAKVEQGSEKADLAGQALEAILSAVEHTVRQAREIATASQEMAMGARRVTEAMTSISAIVEENTAATEQMSAQSGQVAQAIQSIAAVSEEQSASTEEVSASAEEMSAQIEEMSAQAQELSSTAEQLRQLVARFRLEEAVTPGVTPGVAPGVTPGVTSKVVPLRRAA
jgi:methyl-accepting chemotaxis protein